MLESIRVNSTNKLFNIMRELRNQKRTGHYERIYTPERAFYIIFYKVKEVAAMKHYKVGKKIFKTENEARQFSKDLQAYGALGGWSETNEAVTHYYLGDLMTEPIEDYFGLIAEDKEGKR